MQTTELYERCHYRTISEALLYWKWGKFSLIQFIDGLRRVQKGRDTVYEAHVAGTPAPEKKRKYQQADDRIHNVVSTYDDRAIVEYLRGLAHNFLIH